MICSRKLRHWVGTRGHEYFKKDGIYRNKLFMPTRYLYENLKYELLNVNRNDAFCEQDLTDLSDDFLNFLDIDKLPLSEGEFPNFLPWSIQNLRVSRGESGNYSYKRAYCKSFNCYSQLEHGEEKETAMEVFLNPQLLHSELLVYGHTKRQGPPYLARIAAHRGFREFVNMSFFISDKQVTSAEDAGGLIEDRNFPYQRKKLLRVSPEDSFVIGTVFWDSKDGVQRTKETWKSMDNFYREGQRYHVYIGEINYIGGD